jgi:hypothetical protein
MLRVNPNLNIRLHQIWPYYFPSYGDETETEPTSLAPTQKSKLANHVSIHIFNYVHKQITSFACNESLISFLNHVCNTYPASSSLNQFVPWLLILSDQT